MWDRYVSRRSAVISLGTGLAGLLPWPSWVKAAERVLPRFAFLVVSDTHLGRMDQEAPAKQWIRTAKELDAAPGDFVLHLGDVVDGGREAQYAIYKEIRQNIRKPVYEIPGNHDPQELFEKHIRKAVDLSFDHKGVRFLLLNNSHTDSHDGFLSAQQLAWLTEQFAAAAKGDLFVILAMHVPVHENKHPDRGWYVKPKDGQTELYALLARHKDRVLTLLHGHFHNGVRGWSDHQPLQEVVCPSALYNQDRKLAEQKAPGFYLGEMRPGYLHIAPQPGGMNLRYHVVGAAEPKEKRLPLSQFKT